jgi:sugar phosphate isomerase/epimerase
MQALGFSTNAFKKYTLEQAIDSIARIGYGAVELMADLHHAYPTTFDARRRRDTLKRLHDRGLFVSNINAFTHFVDGDTYHPTWFEADPDRTQLRVDHTIRCIELAAEFGAATVSIQPGGPLITSELLMANAYDLFAENLAKCVETAQRCDVVIAIEPEPGLIIERASEYWRFKQRYFRDEPYVGMNCDIGHLFCVGENPASVIRTLHGEIAHLHIEDIGANRVHQHLTPGRGVIDFVEVFRALHEVDYAGSATVELYPYEATAAQVASAAFAHLQRSQSRALGSRV